MISDSKTMLQFVIPKDLKTQLQKEANRQNRSMANLLVTIIKEYLNSKGDSLLQKN